MTIIHKSNGGPASARNPGAERSHCQSIAFLDTNGTWLPTKLGRQVAVMQRTGGFWSHTSFEAFDTEDCSSKTGAVNVARFRGKVNPRILTSSPIGTPCVRVQGGILRDDSALRSAESMRYGQGHNLCLCLAKNCPLEAEEEVLVRVRMRGTSAAFHARVPLKAQSDVSSTLEEHQEVFRCGSIPVGVRLTFCLCEQAQSFIRSLEGHIAESALELACKALCMLHLGPSFGSRHALPKQETVTTTSSHCMKMGIKLPEEFNTHTKRLRVDRGHN